MTTKELVLFIISVSAFMMSLSSWILMLIQNRKRIVMQVYMYKRSSNGYNMYAGFENRSRIPIAITRLFLDINSTLYECKSSPVTALTITKRVGSEIVNRTEYPNIKMPISLAGLGADSGYIVFLDCPEIPQVPSRDVIFLAHTNRGKITLKTRLPDRQDLECID